MPALDEKPVFCDDLIHAALKEGRWGDSYKLFHPAWAQRMDYLLPQTLHGGFVRYALAGVPTGGFMRSVLENDLAGAAYRADLGNLERISDIMLFICSATLAECHGSRAQVDAWLEKGGALSFTHDNADTQRMER